MHRRRQNNLSNQSQYYTNASLKNAKKSNQTASTKDEK